MRDEALNYALVALNLNPKLWPKVNALMAGVQQAMRKKLPGTRIALPGADRPLLINSITLIGYKSWQTKLDPDYLSNKIWFLRKLIFEKNNFVYTFDGKVLPQPLGDPITLTVGQRVKFQLRPIGKHYKIQPWIL